MLVKDELGEKRVDRFPGSVWIGGRGITANAHFDLTHNLYVQIYGTKRFLLISPENWQHFHIHPEPHPSHRQSQVSFFLLLFFRPVSLSLSLSLSLQVAHEITTQKKGRERDLQTKLMENKILLYEIKKKR